MSTDLHDIYDIWASVQFLSGELYIRLSVNIYNTMADYEKLRDAILELQQESPTSERQRERKAKFLKNKDKFDLEL